MKPSMALSLMGSMYLCNPSKKAIEQGKRVLADDTAIFMHDLKKASDEIDVASEREMEDLLREYARLFMGAHRLPCPPREFNSGSLRRFIMQDSADEVQDVFREAGLRINSADMMPNKIGAELNFLAILLRKIGDATEEDQHEYIKIAEEFTREHLKNWGPKFARDMEDAAIVSLYRELAKVTGCFLSFLG